jgi:hypothetical protein
MRKISIFFLLLLFVMDFVAQPANDACLNAISLTSGSNLCNQNSLNSTLQSGECNINFAGSTESSMWYSFTASTPSLVVNFIQNNATDAAPDYVVYGPYTSLTTGCTNVTSACTGGSVLATAQPTSHVSGPVGGVSYNLINGDPGKYTMLTGLNTTAGNNTYLVQVQNNEAGGPNDGFARFCIGVHAPAPNSVPPSANLINNCGITFNGSSAGGYYPSASGAGFSNLDNNAGTQCGACGAGADLTYVINNPSWFTFCSVNTGTYNVQFDVISCVNSSFTGATGGQMAIFTGSTTNLTNVWQATSPTLTNTAVQTSPNFSLAAGGCAYLVVDGFAGDACSYSYVLTNVAGGCILLPIELLSFNAIQKENSVELTWATATELNNDFYTVERSDDGINFNEIEKIDGAGMSANVLFYSSKDINPLNGLSYYRLKQTDFSGRNSYSKMVSVEYKNTNNLEFEIVPNPSIDNVISNIVLNTIPSGEVTIEITNTQGEMLYEVTKNPESNKIEIPNHFSKGIYFVKVIHSDFIQTKRMMIK